jgi:hypothetical protein
MKKLLILLALSAVMASGSAVPKAYYVSFNGKVECNHISLMANRAKVTLPSGQKFFIPLSEIDSYSLNGRVFDKQMLYSDNKPIKRVYMERISERDGFSLYKYSTWLDKGVLGDLYFVYKGNQYNSSVTIKNYRHVLPYFGVTSGKVFVKN